MTRKSLPPFETRTRELEGIDETESTEKKSPSCCSVFSVYFASFLCKEVAMHPVFAKASGMTDNLIGAPIDVHRALLDIQLTSSSSTSRNYV
jgi:hypothetical protein